MDIKAFVSASVIGLAVCTTAAARPQEPTPPVQAPGYSWAESCKSCHEAIYNAWAKTKHATALDRLSGSNQETACIGCHVTGPKGRVLDGRKVVNAGIQCESCHGPGAAHVADPKVKTGLVKVPGASVCEECHNDKGPHFKGFYYDAMRTLVHR